MNILAIETTAVPGSVAVASDQTILGELRLPEFPRAAASLAPILRDLLQMVDWSPRDVDLVSVVDRRSHNGAEIPLVRANSQAFGLGWSRPRLLLTPSVRKFLA